MHTITGNTGKVFIDGEYVGVVTGIESIESKEERTANIKKLENTGTLDKLIFSDSLKELIRSINEAKLKSHIFNRYTYHPCNIRINIIKEVDSIYPKPKPPKNITALDIYRSLL